MRQRPDNLKGQVWLLSGDFRDEYYIQIMMFG